MSKKTKNILDFLDSLEEKLQKNLFFWKKKKKKIAPVKKLETPTFSFQDLKKRILIEIKLKNFEETEHIVHENKKNISKTEIQSLWDIINTARLNESIVLYKKSIHQRDFTEASKHLSEIQKRGEEKQILKYQNMLVKAKQKKLFFFTLKKRIQKEYSSIQKRLSKELRSIQSLFQKKKKNTKDIFAETEALLEKKKEKNTKGNEVLGTPDSEADILDTILKQKDVIKQEEEKAEKTQKTEFILSKKEEEEESIYINPFLKHLDVAYYFLVSSFSLLLLSWLFVFSQTDTENLFLGNLFQQKNLAVQSQDITKKLNDTQKSLKDSENTLKQITQGYLDTKEKVALGEIQARKIDWLKLRNNLEEATLQAFPANRVLRYIEYTNFAGDSEKSTLQISGSVKDPSGRVFLMTKNLMDAINAHPSFSGASINTFSRTPVNDQDEITAFQTNFSLVLTFIP
jgi:hypothetical protein